VQSTQRRRLYRQATATSEGDGRLMPSKTKNSLPPKLPMVLIMTGASRIATT